MLETIITMAITASGGITGSMRRAKPGRPRLRTTPRATGRSTTCNTVKKRAQPSTGTYWLANNSVSRGVSPTARSVLVVVITTDRATSPRPINATTLLAVPPGQHPTRISPTAKGVGRSNTEAMPAASAGITMNWATTPITKGRGRRPTRTKSAGVSPSPIPSMITPSPRAIRGPRNQVNSGGWSTAITAPLRVQSGKSSVKRSNVIDRESAMQPSLIRGGPN